MAQMKRGEARTILKMCGIDPVEDFHALHSVKVDLLLAAANQRGYKKPADANGSTARYFHAYLVRRAFTNKLS